MHTVKMQVILGVVMTANWTVEANEEESENFLPNGNERRIRTNSSKPTSTHNVFTHSKDPKCETRKNDQRPLCARCQNRPGSGTSQVFGEAITADHKVLCEESESILQHRHAVVVRDFHSHRIQCYPTRNKSASGTKKQVQQFLPPCRPARIYTGI